MRDISSPVRYVSRPVKNARVLAARMRTPTLIETQRPIGDLDKEWRAQRRMANGGLGFLPGMHRPVRPHKAAIRSTHVQPFGALRAPAVPLAASSVTSSSLVARPNWLVADLTAIRNRLHAVLNKWHWRPVVYTSQKGLSTNWHTRSLRAVELIGIPLIVIMFLALGSLTLWNGPQSQSGSSGHGRSQSRSVSQSKNASVVLPNGSTSGNGNDSTSTTPRSLGAASNSPVNAAAPVRYAQPLSTTSTSQLVPATNPITDVVPPTSTTVSPSPTPSVPGVTTPLPVTVPGVNLTGADSKPVISTSPTTVTLN